VHETHQHFFRGAVHQQADDGEHLLMVERGGPRIPFLMDPMYTHTTTSRRNKQESFEAGHPAVFFYLI
jgi:hypothetical protein